MTTLKTPSRNIRPIRVQQFASQALQGWYGAGYWKDFEGRRLLCEELGIQFIRTWFDPADLNAAAEMVLPETTDVILEYSVYPQLLPKLRRSRSDLRLHIRAHNAEALQHLHRLPISIWPSRENARRVYGAIRLALQDRQSAKAADSVLGISRFDQSHYWSRLAGKSRLIDVPYFSPWADLRPQRSPLDWAQKKNQVICMPGGWDRLSQQQRTNFVALAETALASNLSGKPEFLLTDYTREGMPPSDAVRILGSIEEPWDLLCESRALAVLTDLGYGMKTTVVDAIAAGCVVFVLPGLLVRLPENVRACCVPLDPGHPGATATLMNALDSGSFVNGLVNLELRNAAKDGLKRAFRFPH
jgi:hypothetical protein